MKNIQNLTISIGNVSKECKTTLHPEPIYMYTYNRFLLSYEHAFILVPILFLVKLSIFESIILIYRISYFPNIYLTSRLYIKKKIYYQIHYIAKIYPHIFDFREACINFEDGCFSFFKHNFRNIFKL